MPFITEKDIRSFILDRDIKDNDGLNLSFTAEEIADAMKRAAREFNSLLPIYIKVSGSTLPDDTNTFLDGTAQQLFISELEKLTRRDIEYSAGGVQTPIARQRIEHLKTLIKLHGERFTSAAQGVKRTINMRRAYRHVR